MNGWHRVFATHEESQILATGPWLGDYFPGVALPSRKALHRWVVLRLGAKFTCAQVMDVGPWATDDDCYVFGDDKPRAEILKGQRCPVTLDDPGSVASVPDGKGGSRPAPISNGAGIDIFPRVAGELGIPIGENVTLDWRWLEI